MTAIGTTGITNGAQTGTGSKLAGQITDLKTIGTKVLRAPFTMGDAWARGDDLVGQCQNAGMRLILQFGYNGGDLYSATDSAAFVAFGKACVRRWGTRVTAYENCNEVNHVKVSPTPDPVKYVSMLGQLYADAKTFNPKVTILTSGLGGEKNKGGGISAYSFISQMYTAAPAHKLPCDGIAYHPYGYPLYPEQDIAAGEAEGRGWDSMVRARALSVSNGDPKDFWITEYGYPTIDNMTQAMQATAMSQAITLAKTTAWIRSLCIFEQFDNDKVLDSPTANDNAFGLATHSRTHKTAWNVVKTGFTT